MSLDRWPMIVVHRPAGIDTAGVTQSYRTLPISHFRQEMRVATVKGR